MTMDICVKQQLAVALQEPHASAASEALSLQSWGAGHMLGTSTP